MAPGYDAQPSGAAPERRPRREGCVKRLGQKPGGLYVKEQVAVGGEGPVGAVHQQLQLVGHGPGGLHGGENGPCAVPGALPDAAGDDVFGTVYYVDDVTWELLLGEAGAEKDAQGCVVVNEVLDSGHEGQQPFGDALLGTRLSLSGTEVSWEVVGLLDEVPGWFWLSRGELESVLPTVLAPASSVAGADREDIGYGMTTLYATADDSSAAAADVDRLLEENPALATWDGVVDERAEAHRSEALYGAIRALLSTFGVAAAAVGVASAFNSSAASVLLRAHDFAVLRSVGMGERDLRRMPALECTRTAAWGLALGLAAALALGAWIGTQGGLTMRSLGLEVPWAHVVGAVALVALALLASCAHALRRLRAAPLIDALRTE